MEYKVLQAQNPEAITCMSIKCAEFSEHFYTQLCPNELTWIIIERIFP